MDLLAFILALAAIALFLVDFVSSVRPVTPRRDWTALGLAFLTGALICQFVHATSSTVG